MPGTSETYVSLFAIGAYPYMPTDDGMCAQTMHLSVVYWPGATIGELANLAFAADMQKGIWPSTLDFRDPTQKGHNEGTTY